VTLRPRVRAELAQHHIEPGPSETPDQLRERLRDLYLVEVRKLRDRRRAGDLPGSEFARATQQLKDRYPLLGFPVNLWEE
jgi:hypothetical protein